MSESGFKPPEMPERMQRILSNAPTVYPDLEPATDAARALWNNPDAYEDGMMVPNWEALSTAEFAFRMGVMFGIEYEQTYPEGMRDEWPIQEAERPVTDQ